MARGGRRNGSGRKPSSLRAKTRMIAEMAIEEGSTPLEMMLQAMRRYASDEDWESALAIAKDAAPYVHAKLAKRAPVEYTGGNTPIPGRIDFVFVGASEN
jgi:hypothetical protein